MPNLDAEELLFVPNADETRVKQEQNYDEDLYTSDDEDEDDRGQEDNASEFQLASEISQHRMTNRTMADLVDLLEMNVLDLNPEYQRGVVWSEKAKEELINSLLEGYSVPPIILNVKTRTENKTEEDHPELICVDGKQRLTSIKEFMSGCIGCRDASGRKWYYCAQPGRSSARTRVLPNIWQAKFRKIPLICYEYEDLDRSQEEALFARVQKGVRLSTAEKWKATRGKWQRLADTFEREFSTVAHLAGEKRSKGWHHLLYCFSQIMESMHPSGVYGEPLLKVGIATIRKMLAAEDLLDDKTERHLRATFSIFADLAENKPEIFRNNGYRHVMTFAPVEMVSVAVMLSIYGHVRSLNLLAGDILWFRKEMRQNHQDLRLNTATWKTAWELIDDLEGQRGAPDGATAAAYTGSNSANPLRMPEDSTTYHGSARQTRIQESPDGPEMHLNTADPQVSRRADSAVEETDGPAINTEDSALSARRRLAKEEPRVVTEDSYDPNALYRTSSESGTDPSMTGRRRQSRSGLTAINPATTTVSTPVRSTRRQVALPTTGGSNVSESVPATYSIEMTTRRKRRTGLNLQATTFSSRRDSNKRIKLSPDDL